MAADYLIAKSPNDLVANGGDISGDAICTLQGMKNASASGTIEVIGTGLGSTAVLEGQTLSGTTIQDGKSYAWSTGEATNAYNSAHKQVGSSIAGILEVTGTVVDGPNILYDGQKGNYIHQ